MTTTITPNDFYDNPDGPLPKPEPDPRHQAANSRNGRKSGAKRKGAAGKAWSKGMLEARAKKRDDSGEARWQRLLRMSMTEFMHKLKTAPLLRADQNVELMTEEDHRKLREHWARPVSKEELRQNVMPNHVVIIPQATKIERALESFTLRTEIKAEQGNTRNTTRS
jgi:hypothetical protein